MKPVYIISAGHSGSTLLDFICGSLPGVISTGELVHLPYVVARDKLETRTGPIDGYDFGDKQPNYCSCGYRFSECSVWKPVVARLSEEIGFDMWNSDKRFQMNAFVGPHTSHHTTADKLRRLLWFRPMRALLFALYSKTFSTSIADRIIQLPCIRQPSLRTWRLYDILGEITNDDFVVDSSKDLLRMLAMDRCRPRQAKVLVLIRELPGVVYSAYKRGIDYEVVAERWQRGYSRINRFLRLMPEIESLFLTYENLVAEPTLCRSQIASFLDIPVPTETVAINTRDNHIIAGNPMRFRGNIEIQADLAWKKALPPDLQDKFAPISERVYHDLRSVTTRQAESPIPSASS